MARPGGSWTRGSTRAALEGVGQAESATRVGDGWVGSVANVLMVTRGQE